MRPDVVLIDCPEECARALDLITSVRGFCELPILAVTGNVDARPRAPRRGRLDRAEAKFRLLAALMEKADAVVSHIELLQAAWGDLECSEDQVKLYVSYLRRSFAAAGIDPVETVRGVGYRYQPRRT